MKGEFVLGKMKDGVVAYLGKVICVPFQVFAFFLFVSCVSVIHPLNETLLNDDFSFLSSITHMVNLTIFL